MNKVDILEMKLNIAELNIPSDDLIKKIIFNNSLTKFDCYGLDILFIIERCNIPLAVNINATFLEEYVNNLINKIAELSNNNYSENELLLFKKYLFYKWAFSYIDISEKKAQFINDIENVLSIQIVQDNAVWMVKENLRLILLDLYTIFDTFDINKAKELLIIVKSNNEKRLDFTKNILDKVYII